LGLLLFHQFDCAFRGFNTFRENETLFWLAMKLK